MSGKNVNDSVTETDGSSSHRPLSTTLPSSQQRLHEEAAENLRDALRWDRLCIADTTPLLSSKVRIMCQGCRRSHRPYCPDCVVPLGHCPPKVRLPVPLDVYRHPNEREGKTTSVHAKLVAPDDCRLFVEDFVRNDDALQRVLNRYPDRSRTLLLFPSADSVTLPDLAAEIATPFFHSASLSSTAGTAGSELALSSADVVAAGTAEAAESPSSLSFPHRASAAHPRLPFDHVVVIDGTWRQARAMCWRLIPHGFRTVRIAGTPRTLFWRYQKYGDFCLATIEAIYWFYKEFEEAFGRLDAGGDGGLGRSREAAAGDTPVGDVVGGPFDNLLFYFKYQYDLIQRTYRESGRPFTARKSNAGAYIISEGDDL
ncbi:DTW domain-containing protein [Zopfochytrium polystomum]|nr:DTW domain-containing protein [Zopfochytrium polystomum]